jgi:hypothetical protein
LRADDEVDSRRDEELSFSQAEEAEDDEVESRTDEELRLL